MCLCTVENNVSMLWLCALSWLHVLCKCKWCWWCCVSPVSADSLFSSLGLGAVVGLGMAGLLLLLVLVDISCFFLRQCGLLMCITRKLCSKKTATSGKSKEMEEGKAAYLWVICALIWMICTSSLLNHLCTYFFFPSPLFMYLIYYLYVYLPELRFYFTPKYCLHCSIQFTLRHSHFHALHYCLTESK